MDFDLKENISKILVKWSMPTRQVAINEIAELSVKLQKSKDQAYKERDLLLAAFSKTQFAFLARHPENEEWEDDWRNIVVIAGITEDLKILQMMWHIHDSELPNFSHLKFDPTFKWDGHTTEEKYKRLARLTRDGMYEKNTDK